MQSFCAVLAITTAVCLAATQDYTTVPHNSPAAGCLAPLFDIKAMSPPPEMLTRPLGMLPPPLGMLPPLLEILDFSSEKWALLLEILLLPPVSTHPAFEVNRPETVGAQVPDALLIKLKKYGKVNGEEVVKDWYPAKQKAARPQQAHAQKQMHTTNHQGR